jgi:PAS domain S-box-containing protein
MSMVSTVSSLLIVAGAMIMALCIKRFGPEARKLEQVSENAYAKIRRFVSIHIALMSFFLVGYVAVCLSIVLDIRIISELFVGIIFFFGAIFVLLGILLQEKMTASLKKNYDQAIRSNEAIRKERKNLSRLNDRLTAEISERIQAEKTITASKAFLQTIIDSLPQQLMVINRDFSIALANRPALDLLGKTALPGNIHCHQVSHRNDVPCSGDEHPCPLVEILHTGKPVTAEHIHTDSLGNPLIVEIVASPIFDEAGEVFQIVESCRDITARRQAEERLLESEQKYRTILESIEDGYFETRLDGTITFVNRSMCRIMGYSRDQLIGMNNRDFSSVETTRQMYRRFRVIFDTGEPSPIATYEVTTRDGETRLLELTATLMHNRNGQPEGFRGVARDVSDLAQAQKALEESEERYRKLSEVTMEGICFNDDSRIIDVNDAFARMFGYPREELIGINAAGQLIAHEYREAVDRVDRTNSHKLYEAIGVRKDGTHFPIEIEGRGITYKGRQVRVASVRDITERKRSEQRLTMMQKMQAIGTLAGGIAHDFNNILASIMGYTEISLLKTAADSPVSSHLQNILQASHRARELVAQILSFSRNEEGEVRPVNVGLIIKETLKLLRPSIPTTIEITPEIDSQVGQIHADPTQIHQILMNLCTNAAHAMRAAGGRLTISLTGLDLDEMTPNRITGAAPGPYVCLTVSDTGKGMDGNTLGRVFEPYFTTKEKGEGTGLGLFVVHGIVQRFNGWVDVASKPGEGTTFSIFFPKIESAVFADPPPRESLPSGTETILFVDDDEIIVAMASEMLSSLGYRVIPAASAADALRIFREVPDSFSLVITDQTMPGMTGEKLIGLLREIKPDIPVIICTGFSEIMNPNKARECGINGFLMKPVEMTKLAHMTRRAIELDDPLTSCA